MSPQLNVSPRPIVQGALWGYSENSALPRPPPPLLYHLAVVITSADSPHLLFAIEKRRFPTSVVCCDITKLQTKNTHFET